MFLVLLFLASLQCRYATAIYEKLLPKTLWPQRCSSEERIINDCNWCHCNKLQRFTCTARVCSGVDIFGHFNDAIEQHQIGMEGHGSWRSGVPSTACTPGMHYEREGLLCICNDLGYWPSSVCRDRFQVLHEVVVTGHQLPSELHSCETNKLYLYGCNICFCGVSGRIKLDSCTKNECSPDDPVLQTETKHNNTDLKYHSEVYAECELNRKYTLGCRKCVCLKNNRLLCDQCEDDTITRTKNNSDYCEKNTYELFSIDCNTCICDGRGVMYCTTRKCLDENIVKPTLEHSKTEDLTLRYVDPPIDESDCEPGTKFNVDCNTCFCTVSSHGEKTLSCTVNPCTSLRNKENKWVLYKSLSYDCVENTVYEANCLVCRCDVIEGEKRESCLLNSRCQPQEERRTNDLDSMHGYCEPTHNYMKGCNTCKCLSDGKAVMCSTRICPSTKSSTLDEPITADITPVPLRGPTCSRGHVYRLDCNLCVCLSGGNLLCTTADCGDK